MTEEQYLDAVERIQRAMAVEPFQPSVIDVVKLLSDWRTLTNEHERINAEWREQIQVEHAAYQELRAENERLRAAIRAYLENDSQANWDALAALVPD